jgi:hypothetical protein
VRIGPAGHTRAYGSVSAQVLRASTASLRHGGSHGTQENGRHGWGVGRRRRRRPGIHVGGHGTRSSSRQDSGERSTDPWRTGRAGRPDGREEPSPRPAEPRMI